MRIARFTTGEDPQYGVVTGDLDEHGQLGEDAVVVALAGDPLYVGVKLLEQEHRLEDVRLLAPVLPRSKVVGIGRNYAKHAAELGNDVPSEPLMFLKPNTSVVGPGDPVFYPPQTSDLHYEGELAVVIGMALVLAHRAQGRWRPRVGLVEVVLMLAIAAVPAVLILLQPDLGTMLVLTATVTGVLAVSGAPRRWLALLAGGGVTAALVAVAGGVLKPYQVDRFLAFTNPDLDPRGAGYNVEQARIAVGNGGVWGQGLFDGSQTRSGFVPEQHTDFVFTVAGEELGLVGAGLLIALLGLVVWRALVIATHTDDVFGRVAAAGIACWFGFQGFQNVGMCLGIMPVTGVPLPFVSYGGSSMFAVLLAVGLLQNIHLRASAPRVR